VRSFKALFGRLNPFNKRRSWCLLGWCSPGFVHVPTSPTASTHSYNSILSTILFSCLSQ
jgi:hypothetical protein